jgi:tRNA:m4X modification enzyme
MDIADFDLKAFLEFKVKEKEISSEANLRHVAIAKHLCGGATDLALTSIGLQEKQSIEGVSIATCCH